MNFISLIQFQVEDPFSPPRGVPVLTGIKEILKIWDDAITTEALSLQYPLPASSFFYLKEYPG